MIGKKVKEMDDKARELNFCHIVVSSRWKAKYGLHPAKEQQVPPLERCFRRVGISYNLQSRWEGAEHDSLEYCEVVNATVPK